MPATLKNTCNFELYIQRWNRDGDGTGREREMEHGDRLMELEYGARNFKNMEQIFSTFGTSYLFIN